MSHEIPSLSLSLLNSRKSKTVFRLALIVFGVGFLVFGAGVQGAQAVTDVTLASPSSGTAFLPVETINFVGTVDTGGDTVTDVSLVVKDTDGNYVVQQTKDEYFKQYQSTGSTISAVHYNEYLGSNIVLNPTYIIDNYGKTCGGAHVNSAPCNVFDPAGGSVAGGYWQPAATLTAGEATMTFDDLYEISSFSVVQHPTYYGRHLKLEYRTSDVSDWVTLYDGATTATKTVDFAVPVFARYFKMTYSDLNSTSLYVTSANVLGKHTTWESVAYDGPVAFSIPNTFGGGIQQWNLRVNDEGVYAYATMDETFLSDNTYIEFSEETPMHESTQSHSIVGSEVTSDFDYLKFFDVGQSLRSWFSFNEATNRNYGDTGTLSNLSAGVTGHVGGSVGSVIIHGLDDILNGGFTFVVSAIIPLATDGDFFDFGISSDNSSGFKMRMTRTNETRDTLNFLRYNGSGYAGPNTVTIDNPTRDQWTRYAISVDILNKKVRFFRNGAYLGEQTFTTALNPRDFLQFYSGTGKYYDEIVILDKFVSSVEGISLTKLTDNDLDLGVMGINTTFRGVVVDENGSYDETEMRTITNTALPVVEDCYAYSKTDTDHFFSCSPTYPGAEMQNIDVDYEYKLDQGAWSSVASSSYKTYDGQTFAVIGDSMSNGETDWIGPFKEYMNISAAQLPTYAVAGNTCTQVRGQLSSVAEGTDNLFVTCGVNGFSTSDNPVHWQGIYDDAKAKGVDKIYMTTMPPWEAINTQNDATAAAYCTKMKTENQWLLDFGASHDDVVVSDIWSYFHDTSGTEKTDCGWRKDITYSSDGVHPNVVGGEYWAEQHWQNGFDKLKHDTKYVEIELERYVNDDVDLYVRATPSYSGITGDVYSFPIVTISGLYTEGDCEDEGYSWYGDVCHTDPASVVSSISTGLYNATQSVSLSADGSTFIRYSTTEMPADCSSGMLYDGPIEVASSQTIYARACNAYGNSATGSFSYTIDTVAPSISSVSETYSTGGRTITWTTDEPASTKVEYGKNSLYNLTTPLTDISPRLLTHTATLSNLSSCTTYTYRVVSTDAAGNEAVGGAGTFTTPGCGGGIIFQGAGVVKAPSMYTDTPVTPSLPVTSSQSNLLPGTSHEDVRRLQRFLNASGFPVAPSGMGSRGNETNYFGTLTRVALIAFQDAHPTLASERGFVGPLTRAFIDGMNLEDERDKVHFTRNFSRGESSDDVRRLQELLATDTDIYPEGLITGYFGTLTERAVGRFQTIYGVVGDESDPGYGFVGPKTRTKLLDVF